MLHSAVCLIGTQERANNTLTSSSDGLPGTPNRQEEVLRTVHGAFPIALLDPLWHRTYWFESVMASPAPFFFQETQHSKDVTIARTTTLLAFQTRTRKGSMALLFKSMSCSSKFASLLCRVPVTSSLLISLCPPSFLRSLIAMPLIFICLEHQRSRLPSTSSPFEDFQDFCFSSCIPLGGSHAFQTTPSFSFLMSYNLLLLHLLEETIRWYRFGNWVLSKYPPSP